MLPVFLRRRILKHKQEQKVKPGRGWLEAFREDILGIEHWNSLETLKKHMQMKVVSGAKYII